jgi:hypothetical protein
MATPLRIIQPSADLSALSPFITRGSNAIPTSLHSKSKAPAPALTPRKRVREQEGIVGRTGSKSRHSNQSVIGKVIDIDEPELSVAQNSVVPEGAEVIDLEELEDKFEAEFEAEQALPPNQAAQATNSTRNLPIGFPWVDIKTIKIQELPVKAGRTVELTNGEFLQITKILKNSVTMMIKLRGWRLKRCNTMGGLLEKKKNELCFIFEVLLDDTRAMIEQSVIEVGLEDVVKSRVLVRTNKPFPAERPESYSYAVSEEQKRHIRETGLLMVRWKYITYYNNATEQARSPTYQGNIHKTELLRLDEGECSSDEQCLSPDILRFQWRGDTRLGGSYNGRKYTFGDICKSSNPSLHPVTDES